MFKISKVNIAILLSSIFIVVLSLFHFGGYSKLNLSKQQSISAQHHVNCFEKQEYEVSRHTFLDLCEVEEIFEEESHEDKLKSKYNYLRHILFITGSGVLPQTLTLSSEVNQIGSTVEQPLYLSNRVIRI